ncbi:unnamed protein product [Pelagomonas calceolata]|uniref:SUN domain-containing protein n=2 Tax=Pelagomonas calceolata TaxID=35677 RepID=A0A8J2WR33_9STRA|nr:unnamed protein product [Pelagomonas calceolata]
MRRLALLLLVAAAVRAEDPPPADAAPAATPGEEVTSPPLPPPDAEATVDEPQTEEAQPEAEETPPSVEEKPAPIMVQDVDDEDDAPAAPKKVINYASKDAGALVVEKSGTSKGFDNLLVDNKDKYGITDCGEKKYVVIGLSEDIRMTELILCQYEKYSSGVRDFDVLGSQTFPTKEWLHLGAFEATYAKREQLFVFPDPKYVRYIKVRFNTHHGDEASCTVSQLKVHGITVMEGMQDDLQRHQKELEEQMESIGEEVLPDEVEVSEEGDAKPADRKEAAEAAAAKAAEAVAELEAAEAALAVEEVRNRTRANATNATTPKNASVGSRMVDAVTGLADVVMGKANKTTTTLPDEIEVVEPVAPASADIEPIVIEVPVVEVVNASNATVSVNTTNATVAANATVSVNTTALNATAAVNATNATLPVVNATRANATAANVTLTPQQRCDYALDFKRFKTQMLAKSKGQNATAAVGTGTQFESVFKTLMDKIRAFEISHSIYELYLGHLQACYAFTLDRLDRKVDDEVSKLRAELAHVLERPRRRFRFFGRR